MSERAVKLPAQRGLLVAGHNESQGDRVITLSGDPEGLRALGELLIAVANLDQSQFQTGSYMDDCGHHLHLTPKRHLHPQSLEIVVSRLDAIRDGALPEWLRPARMKSVRRLSAILPKSA